MWTLCELTETVQDDDVEPDWSRVPEARREMVRSRWIAQHQQVCTSRVYLWSEQISFFARHYILTIVGETNAP